MFEWSVGVELIGMAHDSGIVSTTQRLSLSRFEHDGKYRVAVALQRNVGSTTGGWANGTWVLDSEYAVEYAVSTTRQAETATEYAVDFVASAVRNGTPITPLPEWD